MTDIKFGEAGRILIDKLDSELGFIQTTGEYNKNTGIFKAKSINGEVEKTEWNANYKYWEDVTEKLAFGLSLDTLPLDSKIAYLKTALNICKIPVEDKIAELVISLYEEILKKHGETSLMDISRIQVEIEEKYESKKSLQTSKRLSYYI